MRKIRLNVDALHVDSFTVEAKLADVGTVLAHATQPRTCGSCFGTCQTACDCSLGCPSIAPCTEPIG